MRNLLFLFFLLIAGISAQAQQKMDPGGMHYFMNPKPNTIIYHDTIFTGKKQFEQLFYRTGNINLIRLVEKHQSNKVTGQVLGLLRSCSALESFVLQRGFRKSGIFG